MTIKSLERLDKTYYRAWVHKESPRGYVSGNIPADALVDVVESYRGMLVEVENLRAIVKAQREALDEWELNGAGF